MARTTSLRIADAKRLIEVARDAGLTIARVIARNDAVEIITADGEPKVPMSASDDLDQELAEWKARNGEG